MLAAAPAPSESVASVNTPNLQRWQVPLAALPIVERVKVPAGPGWLGIGYGSVWVSKSESRVVLRIDPATNRIIAVIPVGSDPELGIAFGLGFVWIADPKDKSLTQIDPRTNRVVRTLAANVPDDPEGSIGVGAGSVWLITNDDATNSGTVTRLDALTGKVLAQIKVKEESHAVVFAFGSAWVSSTGGDTVSRIDPARNLVIAELTVGTKPRFLAAGAGSVWVLSQGDGALSRINPRTNRVVAKIALGIPGDGGDLDVEEGYVWASAEGVPVSQIDPNTNQLIRQFVGGRKDDTLRVGFGSAWVVDEDNGEIWRIDLKRLSQQSATGSPST
jgi:streptogramin lyase